MKEYIILAGVNGAGKSTYFSLDSRFMKYEKINLDDIVREMGDWRDTTNVVNAGKIVISRMNHYYSDGISFSQETTLCGKSILRNIDKAKQLGYLVEMHYVGVDSVDIAKARVANRVAKGGHGIAEADIERRYIESFENLKLVLSKCDLVSLYDNTDSFRRIAIYKKGKQVRVSSRVPEWFRKLNI
ncbi:Predicted ABC-type ATPase [Pseudobutyrivibrio sp. YE44]|uniref:zeta toxin family protein n=1 Tax=Pseudobutyrivibrio sp. YE44 TaxID=1520802 RepID=UPI00088D1444|nr:zeta toxin family protein [Pseudobutyrivibrio sp. YE44]SDB37693.1 Predicted ABC-type ATPase [Pseudobutyrivibrio sp. YE44]